MRKLTRLFALMLALTMLLGALPALAEEPANPSGIPYYKVTSDLYDFIDMDGAPIQIEIYSQLANYSGRQTGWGAALMKDLFNVELVIIPDQDGTYQTRTQSGNLGDIVVWGANGEDYKQAIRSRQYYNDELRMIDEQISVQTDYLFNKVDAPVYRNTCAEFFPLGEDMLPVMLEELRKAEKFIFMEYFIIERGEMLDSIVEILEEKAAKGLDVRFMYDSFGSILKAPGDFVRQMRAKGIKCYEFNTFRSILDSRYNNRDHRKICVIDGNVGFTGGVNLADEYINRKVVYGHWKDTAIMIKGEAVWSLTTMFVTLWDSSFNQTDNLYDYIPTKEFNYNDGYFAPYTDYPFDNEPAGKTVYYNMINRANDYVYIMTPYLILDNVMITALANAAKNGIDVRIITPGVPDKKIAYMLTQSYYEVLIKAGVKIYEYTPGFVHAKIFVSDDETAVVGTINLDYRSLTHHFENAIWMYKSGAVKAVLDDYRDTLDKCRVVTLETARKKSFIKRLLMPVLRLFSPMF